MTEYRYTKDDRIIQLNALKTALSNFIAYLENSERFKDRISVYKASLEVTINLLENGFEQKQLSELGRNTPDLFHRHKEWIPPLEENDKGKLVEPEWFQELETYLQPVLKTASVLSIIGYY